MNRTESLAYWINERYAMKVRRKTPGKWAMLRNGWSDDPVMGTTRWCNVHREDDKVTRWMRDNWSTHESPIWWFALGRFLNYIPTLESIVEHGIYGRYRGSADPAVLPSLDGLREGLKAKRAAGKKVFTSAYTISTCGVSMDKIDYVMGVMGRIQAAEENRILPCEAPPAAASLENAHKWLTSIKGLGSFLAAQIIADMKNTKGHPLQQADDWYTWAAPGPGSMRGLEAYFGAKVSLKQFMPLLRRVKTEVEPLILPMPPICMQDMQNCMCEFSKYVKLSTGKGHARNRYRAG